MTLLERVLQVLKWDAVKEQINAPGWRGTGTRMKKNRTPFQGREHRYHPLKMKIEKFKVKEDRDARFSELQSQGMRHVSKFSDVEHDKSFWCVVHP